MKVQIQKWGNSLALRIPKSFATESFIEQGSTVDVSVQAGQLIVTPIRKKKYTLDELLAGVTEENRHGEIDTGASVGHEAW
jgi:antitoxin MazE